ncbi:MAG: hypothetical protein R3297_09815, partial [Desulfobulbales bacterium]|nr:hypothetical protein [Desulfobulbales bacterium]
LPTIDNLHKENEPAAKRRKKVQPITRRFTAGLPLADRSALLGSVKRHNIINSIFYICKV